MIYLPRTGNTRLVQVHGLDGGFPYYGELTTEPPGAAGEFRQGGVALVEDSLLQQFDAQIGDSIGVGNLTNRIIGRLQKVPGENVMLSAIAPRVYVSLTIWRAPACWGGQPGELPCVFQIQSRRGRPEVGGEAPSATRKIPVPRGNGGGAQTRAGQFARQPLSLSQPGGIHCLVAGGVGVASAIHVHIKQKLGTAAVLRCLGCSVAQTFAIYLAQSVAWRNVRVGGRRLGRGHSNLAARDARWFHPLYLPLSPSLVRRGQAVLVGFAICLLFALLPLLEVRRVSPLATLRVSFESEPPRRDPLYWLASAVLAAGVIGFALVQSHNWRIGLGLPSAWDSFSGFWPSRRSY